MQRRVFAIVLFMGGFSACAENEGVFRRVLKVGMFSATEEVEAIPNSTGKPRDEILTALKGRQWPEAIVSVDLLANDGGQPYRIRLIKLSKSGLTAGFPSVGKTVFQRKVHPMYVYDYPRNIIDILYSAEQTQDEIVNACQSRTWPRNVISVEVLSGENRGPILRITASVSYDMVQCEQEFLLSERTKKEWGIGHDTTNFVYDKSEFSCGGYIVEELYRNKQGARVWVVHRRIDAGDADDHGLFSRVLSTGSIICRALTFQDIEAGRALSAHFTLRGGKKIIERHVMWRTAPDHVVDVVYRTESVDDVLEIIRIYAKAFPSTIPATLKIDKTGWGRAEIVFSLKGMRESFSKDPYPFKTILDRFERDLGLLNRVLKSPVEEAAKGDAERQKQLATLEEWWKENAEKTTWDEESGRLVVGPPPPPAGDK